MRHCVKLLKTVAQCHRILALKEMGPPQPAPLLTLHPYADGFRCFSNARSKPNIRKIAA
jgi:hypothetical protein